MHYIIQDMQVISDSGLYALRIMGMDFVTFVLVLIIFLLLALIAGYFIYTDSRRRKNIEFIRNGDRVLLEIVPMSGNKVIREVVESFQGEAKKIEHNTRGTFLVSRFVKSDKLEAAEPYQLWPGCGHLDDYPYDAPENQRVTIVKYYFNEGDPAPKLMRDPKEWDTERYVKTTTAFARLARETKFAEVMQGQFSGFFDKLFKALPNLEKISLIMILCFVIIGMLAINLYFGFTTNSGIHTIIGR